MKTSKIIIFLFALALTGLFATSCTNCDAKKETEAVSDLSSNKNSTLETILTRTSIRAYTKQKIGDDKLEQILRAGMAAPTAVNKQPWAFVVRNQQTMLDSLAANLPYAKMIPQAPLAIAVCGDLSKALENEGAYFWIQDCSAATENILLAAHSLGLGAVWTGVYPMMEKVKIIQRVLSFPENIVPLCIIPMGYPAEQPAPKDKWKPENIHYNKW